MGRRLQIACLFVAAMATVRATSTTAQQCPEGEISFIFVNSHPVFDTDDRDGGKESPWIYNVANKFHMETDEEFLRGELLFEVGDCYDSFRVAESERIIRRLGFIARIDISAIPQPDGSVHIVVDTQDKWTFQVTARARLDDGFEFNGLDVSEQNVAGKGIALGAYYNERRERRELGGGVQTQRFFGTRWNAHLQMGRTRVGDALQQGFVYPFVGEVGRYAFRQSFISREELFAYALSEGTATFSHVVLPVREEATEITLAGRLGRPGRLTILAMGVSKETLDFTGFDKGVEIIRNKDFSNPEPAPEVMADQILPQTRGYSATRLNFILGQRNLHFQRREGLDALRGVLDVPIGTEAALAIGRTIGFSSPDILDKGDDFFARLRLFGGFTTGQWVLASTVSLEGRTIISGPPEHRWRDILGEFDIYGYWQPEVVPRHTLFARLSGAGGWSMTGPFQLTLGGSTGVRGYSLDRLPGGRRLTASLEDRIYLGSPGDGLFDLGMTAFVDMGSVWKGDVPFGFDSGRLASGGLGLRVGFPNGTRGVIRIDVAMPMNGPDAFSGATFRITASELLGLIEGFEDHQLSRSRRGRVGVGILPDPSSGR